MDIIEKEFTNVEFKGELPYQRRSTSITSLQIVLHMRILGLDAVYPVFPNDDDIDIQTNSYGANRLRKFRRLSVAWDSLNSPNPSANPANTQDSLQEQTGYSWVTPLEAIRRLWRQLQQHLLLDLGENGHTLSSTSRNMA